MKSVSAYGTLVFRVGVYAAAFLPQRVALAALDLGARALFGPAEPAEFTDTRGNRVSL